MWLLKIAVSEINHREICKISYNLASHLIKVIAKF
jgi:hypothetical protein